MAVTRTQHYIVWAIAIIHILMAYDFHSKRAWNEYENLKRYYNGVNQGNVGGREYIYYYPPFNLYVLTKWWQLVGGL